MHHWTIFQRLASQSLLQIFLLTYCTLVSSKWSFSCTAETTAQTKLRRAHAFFYFLNTVSDLAEMWMDTSLDIHCCGSPAAFWELCHVRGTSPSEMKCSNDLRAVNHVVQMLFTCIVMANGGGSRHIYSRVWLLSTTLTRTPNKTA